MRFSCSLECRHFPMTSAAYRLTLACLTQRQQSACWHAMATFLSPPSFVYPAITPCHLACKRLEANFICHSLIVNWLLSLSFYSFLDPRLGKYLLVSLFIFFCLWLSVEGFLCKCFPNNPDGQWPIYLHWVMQWETRKFVLIERQFAGICLYIYSER